MPVYKEQIQRFYRKFAPNKQVDADTLLKKYKGSESVLLSELYIKYLLVDEKGYGTGTPFEEAVRKLYERYTPGRSEHIPDLVAKYQGNPENLIVGIVNKYEFRDVAATSSTTVSHKSKLTEIYRTANPNKVGDIDALLVKYKGHEGDLVKAVKAKYKSKTTSSTAIPGAFKTRLTDLYRRYNPGKVAQVDALVMKYKGNQASVLAAIEAKYHPKRNELVTLYTKYNPSKVGDVDSLLIKYKGKEDKLIQQIKAKYEALQKTGTPSLGIGTPPSFSSPTAPPTAATPVVPPIAASAPPLPLSTEAPAKEDTPTSAPTETTVSAPATPPPTAPVTAIPPTPLSAEAPAKAEVPVDPSLEAAAKEAERLRVQQEAEAKKRAEDETKRLAKAETDRKAAADLVAKQQAEEQKRKAAVATATKQKKTGAQPKKKMNLTPILIVGAIIIVLGGGTGGYYYKFGWTLPFTSDTTEEKAKQDDKVDSEKSPAKKKKKKKETPVTEEAPKLEVPKLELSKSPGKEEAAKEEVTTKLEPKPAAKPKPKPKPAAKPKPKPKPKPVTKATPPPATASLKFHLAAGSFTVEQNARALHKKLKSQGYNAVYLGRIGEYYKVSYQSFKKEADAKAALQSLTDKGVSSWMLRHELK